MQRSKIRENLRSTAFDLLKKHPHYLRAREKALYPLFANWLVDVLEEVAHANTLCGNTIKDRWCTPDVIAKAKKKRSFPHEGEPSWQETFFKFG